jgi:hypothetical protein
MVFSLLIIPACVNDCLFFDSKDGLVINVNGQHHKSQLSPISPRNSALKATSFFASPEDESTPSKCEKTQRRVRKRARHLSADTATGKDPELSTSQTGPPANFRCIQPEELLSVFILVSIHI